MYCLLVFFRSSVKSAVQSFFFLSFFGQFQLASSFCLSVIIGIILSLSRQFRQAWAGGVGVGLGGCG